MDKVTLRSIQRVLGVAKALADSIDGDEVGCTEYNKCGDDHHYCCYECGKNLICSEDEAETYRQLIVLRELLPDAQELVKRELA